MLCHIITIDGSILGFFGTSGVNYNFSVAMSTYLNKYCIIVTMAIAIIIMLFFHSFLPGLMKWKSRYKKSSRNTIGSSDVEI